MCEEDWSTLFMSTPITCPDAPTFLAAWKTSKPAPLPRSMTVSPSRILATAKGLPQLNPKFDSVGIFVSSSLE